MKREFQINFLKRHGLSPDHKFLDLGCGTLRGGIPVLKYLNTGNYYGIDIREETIIEAKAEVKEERLSLKQPKLIFFEDFSQLQINQKFDLIWAFSVLIHMEDDILDKCILFVKEHLKAGGRFFANVNLGER
ncbi:MAG: class I SAM-dependent methyltransferase, partial [Bacteroidota bacterium]